MLYLSLSAEAEQRLRKLDDRWEQAIIKDLPFPIAYVLTRIRQDPLPWDILLKDALNVLLRYLALLGVSEYLQDRDVPDYDVNDELKNIGRVMPEGDWLGLARACALRRAASRPLLPLAEAISRLEQTRDCSVRLRFDRYDIRTDSMGALSAMVVARNKLFAHGVSPTQDEKKSLSAELRALLRLIIRELTGVWSCELCVPMPCGKSSQHFRLTGMEDFATVTPPPGISPNQSFLTLPDGGFLPLFPLALAERVKDKRTGTLLDQTAELYLLNYLERSKIPVYFGLGGSSPKRPDLSGYFESLFGEKRVWQTRQDIHLDRVLQYVSDRTRRSLDYFEWNNLYHPSRYAERKQIETVLDDFLIDDTSRILFVAGVSGTGKTATTIHWAHALLARSVPVCVIRAAEMPAKPGTTRKRFEEWLCDLHGYAGTFDDILARAMTGTGRFVLVIEGLNEFLAAGRDLDGLWRAINGVAEEHAAHRSLKIVLTTRVDRDSINVYFPGGAVPGFTSSELFYHVDGKPWLTMGGFSPDEITGALRAHGLDAQSALTAHETHGEALASPALLARYADGVLSGADIKKITKGGITKDFVSRCVTGDKVLSKNLDRLVSVLSRNKRLQASLSEIERHDRALGAALVNDNCRMLHRMRELGLVLVDRTEGEDGRPTTTISLGHDSLFEFLWFRRSRRSGLRFLALCTAALAFFLLFLAGIVGYPVNDWVSARSQEARGTVNQFFNAAHVSARQVPQRELDRLRSESLAVVDEIENTARKVLRAILAFLILNAFSFMALLYGPACAWMVIDLWLQRKRRVDFRVRYLSQYQSSRATRPLFVGVTLSAVACVIWALFCIGLHVHGSLYTDRPSEFGHPERMTVVLPLLVFLALLCLFGPAACSLLAFRTVQREKRGVLKHFWFSRTEVWWSAVGASRWLLCLASILLLAAFVTRLSPADLAWGTRGIKDAEARVTALYDRTVALADEVRTVMGKDSPVPASPRLGGLTGILDEPWVRPVDRGAVDGLLAGAWGLFFVGCMLWLGFTVVVSRRLFPEQWGKS